MDWAGKARKDLLNLCLRRPNIACRDNGTLQIKAVRLRPKADRKVIDFGGIEHASRQLRCLSNRNGKNTRR